MTFCCFYAHSHFSLQYNHLLCIITIMEFKKVCFAQIKVFPSIYLHHGFHYQPEGRCLLEVPPCLFVAVDIVTKAR